jgi:hypothetical protein
MENELINAIHKLRETIKYLLRTPDLNLENMEDDTYHGIDKAYTAIKETDHLCPFVELCKEVRPDGKAKV